MISWRKNFVWATLVAILATGVLEAETISSLVVGEDDHYVSRSGDSTLSIAKPLHLAIEHLSFANDLPVELYISPGRSLLLPLRRVVGRKAPKTGVYINLPERMAYLIEEGRLLEHYPIAIGKPGRFATPTGRFSILEKVIDPTWLPPEWAEMEEEEVPPGPDNPLGDRWMSLNRTGLGMHSTTSPSYVGAAVSHGCMRIFPSQVHEFFDTVEISWPVVIDYSTAQWGWSQDHRLVLVSFPDVYERQEALDCAWEKARKAGFAEMVDPDLVAKICEREDGVVYEVTQSPPEVLAPDGRTLPVSTLLYTKGRLWINREGLSYLGVELAHNPGEKEILVAKGRVSKSFSFGSDKDKSCIVIEGRTWLLFRDLMKALNWAFIADPKGTKIRVL